MEKSVIKDPVTLGLKTILKNKLSGELILKGKTFKKSLFIENGELVYARSNVIQERLGEILFKLGKLSRSEFWNIHKLMEGTSEKIGKVLVENNILSKKDLFFGIQTQIKIIAKSVFYLNSGTWDFIEKKLDIPEDSKFHQNLSDIIIESSELIKNTFYFKNIYGEHEAILSHIEPEIRENLKESQKEIIEKLRNPSGLSCNEICTQFDFSEDQFWKEIIILFILDIIDFREVKEKKEVRGNIEDILRLYEKIKLSDTDYYSLLDLGIDASQDDIKKKYFLLAKKYHPDRLGETPDPEVREKANFVFAEINRAYDTLENPEKRKEYDIKKFKKSDDEEISKKSLKEKASVYYRKARTLYNRKQYWETTALMEEAIKSVKDKGVYFMLLGLAQMNIESMKWTAEKNLLKAAELEPMSAEPYVALGKLFLNENMENRSKAFFKKALSIDPDNKSAKELLNQLNGISTSKIKKGLFFSKKSEKSQ